MSDERDIGYMCMIEFEDEMGMASGGVRVYPSLEDLKENHDCWQSCGIVKVKVSLVETIHEQNLGWNGNDEDDLR